MPQSETLPKFVKPKRIIGGEHPLIAVAKQQLEASQLQTDPVNLWYICRFEGGEYDFFLGKATESLSSDIMQDLTTKPSCSRRCLAPVQTAFGENFQATICGVMNKQTLTEDQKNVITRYFNPYRETTADVHPEIFTFTSSFNHVIRHWPMINNPEHIRELPQAEKYDLLADLLTAGRGVLELEADFKYINLAAKSLRIMEASTRLRFHIAADVRKMLLEERNVPEQNVENLAPEPHSLVYFPNLNSSSPQIGEVIVPIGWIWAAFRRPIPALCSLLYVSSLIRDDYYGKLLGSEIYSAREYGYAEMSNLPIAIKRAEGLVVELHREVNKYDGRVYFINSKADGFMRVLQGKYPYGALSNLYYPDPPDRQKERIYHI